ncbi:424_t:CDS:1 [Acaulospora colombiana]|uniref:424_t:CDS:1 n=1 Tax=Acaulospora colombiana TaxID=27376 RepID=A0ACA9M374_9GLOM|nr:424_t:CDS:1 [Acaulospora colombiana]
MSQNNGLSMSISVMSVTFLTFISGYGATKLYNTLMKQQNDAPFSCQKLLKLTKTSSRLPQPRCNEIEKLVITYNKLQRDAIYTRNKYKKKLNIILEEIEEIREEIYNFECQTAIKIFEILDEIEICHNLSTDSNSVMSHIKGLKLKLEEEEENQNETLELMQIELGHLIWKYEELEKCEIQEWRSALKNLQKVQSQLCRATNWAMKVSKKREIRLDPKNIIN